MPRLRRHSSCCLAAGRNHIYFASISPGRIHSGPGRVCERGRSMFSCPCGDAFGLACFRFYDLHRGATLPGMGPFHRKQCPVWEHAKPSCTQQSPVEEPAAQATQKQWRWLCWWQPRPHRPRDWEWGADCDWRHRPLVPARPAPCSAHREWELPWAEISWEGSSRGSSPLTQPLSGFHPGALWNATLLPLTCLPSFFQVYRSHSSPQH